MCGDFVGLFVLFVWVYLFCLFVLPSRADREWIWKSKMSKILLSFHLLQISGACSNPDNSSVANSQRSRLAILEALTLRKLCFPKTSGPFHCSFTCIGEDSEVKLILMKLAYHFYVLSTMQKVSMNLFLFEWCDIKSSR